MVVAEATAQQRVGAPKAGGQAAAAGGCCCCACCVSEPEALSWRHAFRSLHPLTLLRITGRSLSPRHHADLLALQLLAVAPAALLTPTGGDWAWAGLFRPASPTAIVLAGLALGLGMLLAMCALALCNTRALVRCKQRLVARGHARATTYPAITERAIGPRFFQSPEPSRTRDSRVPSRNDGWSCTLLSRFESVVGHTRCTLVTAWSDMS